jgi:hypothetical protein
MADLGNRANVNSAIDLLLDDLQPDEAIQPSDHNVLLKDILDTLANGLSTVLRTGNTTDGENLTITSSSIFQFANGSNGRLQSDTLTAFRNWTLPDTTGTIALLSDIPSANNIYTANGTLTGNRTVDLDNKILKFTANNGGGIGIGKSVVGGLNTLITAMPTSAHTRTLNILKSSTDGLAVFADDGIVFNSPTNSKISTEFISLQGSTLIKGNGTSTGSALAIYNNDTTPGKLWDFLDNGRIVRVGPISIGENQSLTDARTVSLGKNVSSSGFDTVSIGQSLTTSDNYTTNIGTTNTVSGSGSLSVGSFNTVTGSLNFCIGSDSFLTGSKNIGIGLRVYSAFSDTIGIGKLLLSNANGASLIGYGVSTSNRLTNSTSDSLALGWNTTTPQHLFKSDGVNLTLSTDSTGTVVGDVWSQNGTVKIGNPSANITTVASVGGLTVNADTTEMAKVLALATNITINAPTGTPNDNQSLWFRILDNGTSRTITLNAVFEDYTGNFPTSTTAGKYLIFAGKWNADEGKWNILAWKVQP